MIRVLIVDDSSFMRKSLRYILESDKSIKVVGTGSNGEEAVRKVKQIYPDVVLLDIEMPRMDGLSALAHIMSKNPTPVVMLSALNKREADIAVKSLDYGAVDFIAKPSGVISYDIDKLSDELITKVKTAAYVNVRKLDIFLPQEKFQHPGARQAIRKRIVIIGSSTGGPRAVDIILSALPRDISTAVIVVQHMSQEFVPSFVERLQWGSSLKISMARKGETISPGKAMIAPGGYHTLVLKNGNTTKIRLSRKASLNAVFPSIDYAMESVAKAYGKKALGVLLTGLGSDGAKGMKAIKEAGGSTIVEDRTTSVVFGMPKAAIQLGCVDEVLPLPQIAQAILRLV